MIHPLTWAAAAAWVGAMLAPPVPVLSGPIVFLAGWRTGRSWLVCLGLLLLTASMAIRASEGLEPVERGEFTGQVTLVGDPERFGPSLRVDLRVGSQRIEAWARGREAAAL